MRARIEAIVNGGLGLARIDGEVVFVDYAIDKELIEIEITQKKKGYSKGRIKSIIEPSPHRIEPPCPYYTLCGGCDLQHIRYDHQLEIKKGIVKNTIKRIAKIDVQIAGIHPSNMQFGYRKRVDFSCLKGRWGFLKKGSSEFIGIDRCLLADDAINDYIKNNSCMRKTRIEIDDKGRINQKQMYLDIGVGKPLTYRLGAFSQINRNINIKLIERITSIAKQTNSKTAIEFFCGIGNFTIPLSLNQISITALEWDKNAVLSLKDNIKAFGIKNIAIQRANLMQPFRINTEFDLAILDPPREGARYVAEWLRRRKVNWIIYVSCEPSTLARDLFMLKESYTIESVELFDMFPQTHHIETLVLLKLK